MLTCSLALLQSLEPFYDGFDPDFVNIRKTVREVLQKEDDLNEIVQLVGKVSLTVLGSPHPPPRPTHPPLLCLHDPSKIMQLVGKG